MPYYYEDYRPVNVMYNGEKIAGWTEQEYNGKEISVDGTYQDNLSVVLKGEHTQKTNSGSNLLPFPYTEMYKEYNGVTYEVQDDGGIAVSGTPTDYSYMRLYRGSVPNSDKITISISGTFTNIMLNYTLRDATDATLANASVDAVTGGSYKTIDIVNEYPTATSLEIIIKRRGNAVCSGVIYVMINAGDTPLPYEQYNPSKNLIDPYSATRGVPVYNGVTNVSAWGNEVFNADYVRKTFKPSTTYYLKMKIRLVSQPTDTNPYAYSRQKGFMFYSGKTGYSNIVMHRTNKIMEIGEVFETSGTFTTPDNLLDDGANYKIVGYSEYWVEAEGDNSGGTAGTIDFLDLIISEIDVPFSLYGSTVTAPSLDCPSDILPVEEPVVKVGTQNKTINIELFGMNGVSDTIEKDGNRYKLTRYFKSIILDGTENWSLSSSSYFIATIDKKASTTIAGLCTHHKYDRNYSNDCIFVNSQTIYTGKALTVFFESDVNAWKEYLANQYAAGTPVTIVYLMEEPIVSYLDEYAVGSPATIYGSMSQTATPSIDNPQAIEYVKSVTLPVAMYNTDSFGNMYGNGTLNDTFENDVPVDGARKSRLTKHWAELTLDGTEKWLDNSSGDIIRYCVVPSNYDRSVTGLCTHLPKTTSTSKKGVYFGASVNYILDGSWTLDSWKAYVTAQYTAGTPIKLLYKLLEPEVILGDPVPLYTIPKHTDITCEAEMTAKIKTVEK